MPDIFEIRNDIEYCVDRIEVEVCGQVYTFGRLKNCGAADVPPLSFTQFKSWLRCVSPEPDSPVAKDPLDQYLFELCGTVFDKIDAVTVTMGEYRTGESVNAVAEMINEDPFRFIDEENLRYIGNYLTGCVFDGSLKNVKMLRTVYYNFNLRRIRTRYTCGAIEKKDGTVYTENPVPSRINDILRVCRQISSGKNSVERMRNAPYELLVDMRGSKGFGIMSVPRATSLRFVVLTDGESAEYDALNKLEAGAKLSVRRSYWIEEGRGALLLVDLYGRCVGDVPQTVAGWMTAALDYCYASVTTVTVDNVRRDEYGVVIALEVSAELVVIEQQETAALLSYHIIKNFIYNDENPSLFAIRIGVVYAPWLGRMAELYREYQKDPDSFLISNEMKLAWRKIYNDGAIEKRKSGRNYPDNKTPLPHELVSKREMYSSSDYSDMLDSLHQRDNISETVRLLILRGRAYKAEENITCAEKDFYRAYEMLEKSETGLDPVYFAYACTELAKIHIAYDAPELAVEYFGRAAAILETEKMHGRKAVTGMLVSCYLLGGDLCMRLERFETAIDAYTGAIDVICSVCSEEMKTDEQTASVFCKRGDANRLAGYIRMAHRDYFRAIETMEGLITEGSFTKWKALIAVYRRRASLFEEGGYTGLAKRDMMRASQIAKLYKKAQLQKRIDETREKLAFQQKSIAEVITRSRRELDRVQTDVEEGRYDDLTPIEHKDFREVDDGSFWDQ